MFTVRAWILGSNPEDEEVKRLMQVSGVRV
jgi:hypothetical protein